MSEAISGAVSEWSRMSLRSSGLRSSLQIRLHVLAARCARSFAGNLALEKQRAQGRPGARCTRGLACDCAKQNCTRAYRFSGNTPAFPAQWLYGLLRAHPGERALLSPSLPDRFGSLTPASRHQVHTTSSYATAAFVFAAFASTAPRPSFATMANAPLTGRDGRFCRLDSTCRQSGMFSRQGLDQHLG